MARGENAARLPVRGAWRPSARLLLAGLAVAVVAAVAVLAVLMFSGAFWPKARYAAAPVGQTSAGSAAPLARAPRPTPVAEVRQAVAQGDVVEAAREYVGALYAADDLTAVRYQGGYTDLLRKDENDLALQGLDARPMSWGEAGYLDADPSLEWAEVVARVQSRTGATRGNVYYKLGFRREGDSVQIDMSSRRMDLR